MSDFDRLKEAMETERIAPRPGAREAAVAAALAAFDAKTNRPAKDRAWSAVSGMRRVPLPKS